MDREILFRGKRIDNGEWVVGNLMQDPDLETAEICGWEYSGGGFEVLERGTFGHRVVPSTVGQYTGTTDKNGVKIFEGDIISVKDEFGETYRFKVIYGPCGGVSNVNHIVGYMGFYLMSANDETHKCMEYGTRNDPLYYLNAYDCEVIGNIHDGKDNQHDEL